MSALSSIEWTDRTWNPVRGCSVISPGCVNCYAMKQAHRFSGAGKPYDGLTKLTKAGPQWTGVVRPVESALLEPLSWRKPARVFVNSMSDLFHEDVPDEFIDRVFAVMALAPQHTFQILTKRPERMLAVAAADAGGGAVHQRGARCSGRLTCIPQCSKPTAMAISIGRSSAANPARRRGGSTSHGPVFVKQLGAKPYERDVPADASHRLIPDGSGRSALRDKKWGDPSEWPADIRVREFPVGRGHAGDTMSPGTAAVSRKG